MAATAVEVEAGMAKPIHTGSKEVATIRRPAIHTPNKQAIPMLHSLPLHNKPMEGDSNREATRVDTIRLRQRVAAALLIQPVQARRVAAMVKSTPSIL